MLDSNGVKEMLGRMHEHPALAPIARHPWFVSPVLSRFEQIKPVDARYTMVVPVFNQEQLIGKFLEAHFAMATLSHDIIAIFDCCSDDSLAAFWKGIADHACPLVSSVTSIVTGVPFFETACDNLGFAAASTDFIIEYQADMLMGTHGYDARMLSGLADERVFCVSGRCGHSLLTVYGQPRWPRSIGYRKAERQARIGLCGSLIEKQGADVDDRQKIGYFSETVNRGPIAFRRADLASLNYLDHANFFLGDDDHDINLRAYLLTGRLPAYIPIKIRSDLAWGSTRKPRDPLNAEIFQKLKARPDTSALGRFKDFYRPYCSPAAFALPE
jgi:Glycosyltransferases involved in cell wall biogenesis